jgi:hypothetical protein
MPQPRRGTNLRTTLLDPGLDRRIKIEPISRPSSPNFIPSLETSAFHRAYGPQQNWPASPYEQSPSIMGTSNGYMSDAEDDDDSSYSYLPHSSRQYDRRRMHDANGEWYESLRHIEYMPEDMDTEELANDSTKLKGEIWPGMDIFDSATLDMRRKRNQKKSTNVVVQLEATSLTVQPTEQVFDTIGTLQRERVITGEPTTDDPLEGETSPEPGSPPAKKRNVRGKGNARRPRPALVERDINSGRTLRGRRVSTRLSTSTRSSARGAYYDGSDDLEDESLTYQQQRPQRRTGLSIHRDNTGPDITFDRNPSMSYLTAGFQDTYPTPHNAHTAGYFAHPAVTRINHAGNVNYQHQSQYRHQDRPSLGSFRTNQQHGLPARDLSAFGALTNHAMFPSSTYFGATHVAEGASALNSIHQPFPSNPQPNATHFNLQDNNGLSLHNFDVFASNTNSDVNMSGLDFNFGANETSGLNPLFLDGGPLPEDDERTVSAPLSEHSVS